MKRLNARRLVRRGKQRCPAAFTLLELIVGVVILAVLMSAMVASVGIASRALDDGTTQTGKTLRAASVVEEINADLALTLAFSERTATAVTFTVPDRDGDTNPEVIRYSWGGATDGRLLRQVNGGPAVALAENVSNFALTYQLRTAGPEEDDGSDKGGKGKGGKGKGGKGKDDKGKDDKDKDDKDKDDKDKGK